MHNKRETYLFKIRNGRSIALYPTVVFVYMQEIINQKDRTVKKILVTSENMEKQKHYQLFSLNIVNSTLRKKFAKYPERISMKTAGMEINKDKLKRKVEKIQNKQRKNRTTNKLLIFDSRSNP